MQIMLLLNVWKYVQGHAVAKPQKHSNYRYIHNTGKGKGKAAPLQAWSSPEGSRKLRLPNFMTTTRIVVRL